MKPTPQSTAISYTAPHLAAKAQLLAASIKLPLISQEQHADYQHLLMFTPQGLTLCLQASKQTLMIDFLSGKANYRRLHGGGYKQLIARACAVKKNSAPSILDLTAGLGQDAFALACLGCPVQMMERSPIIAALLNDALQRLQTAAALPDPLSLQLIPADARNIMHPHHIKQPPDVIYLDPMHPQQRKSALVKQEMRILRRVVGDDEDAEQLFEHVLACTPKRIVVKRPRLAHSISAYKPDLVYSGKSSRFDVYIRIN